MKFAVLNNLSCLFVSNILFELHFFDLFCQKTPPLEYYYESELKILLSNAIRPFRINRFYKLFYWFYSQKSWNIRCSSIPHQNVTEVAIFLAKHISHLGCWFFLVTTSFFYLKILLSIWDYSWSIMPLSSIRPKF